MVVIDGGDHRAVNVWMRQCGPSIFRATDQTSTVVRFDSYRTNKEMTDGVGETASKNKLQGQQETKVYSI